MCPPLYSVLWSDHGVSVYGDEFAFYLSCLSSTAGIHDCYWNLVNIPREYCRMSFPHSPIRALRTFVCALQLYLWESVMFVSFSFCYWGFARGCGRPDIKDTVIIVITDSKLRQCAFFSLFSVWGFARNGLEQEVVDIISWCVERCCASSTENREQCCTLLVIVTCLPRCQASSFLCDKRICRIGGLLCVCV